MSAVEPVVNHQARGLRSTLFVRGSLSTRSGRVGLVLVGLVVALALFGPLFDPGSPTAIVGTPFQHPSTAHIFGTDFLGRDALSRWLHGGRTLVLVAFSSTVLAYLIGIPVGTAAGFGRGAFDYLAVGASDLLFAFPGLIFLLVLLSAVGRGLLVAIVGIAIVNTPRVVRIVRSVTIEVSTLEFVEAAVARGERVGVILRRDVLSNIWSPVLADFGLRITASVFLFASLSFLGMGEAPPAAEWGLMISENRIGLLLQPWVVVVPAVTIGVFMVGVNLVADAIARSAGHSITGPGV
jgi:peptide/nickel transport system permease protein